MFRHDPKHPSIPRFANSRFTFLASRIVQKRKQWLAEMLELGDETSLGKVLGAHWWFHFGKALCEVVMPEDFYKVGPPANRRLDGVGQRALERDWAAWLAEPSDDLMRRSQFNLFYDIGIYLFGRNSGQARDYAMYFVGRSQRVPPVVRGPDPQRYFRLPASD